MSNFLLNMAALTHSVPLGSLRDCSALAASRSPPQLSLFALCGWKEMIFVFVPLLIPLIFPTPA